MNYNRVSDESNNDNGDNVFTVAMMTVAVTVVMNITMETMTIRMMMMMTRERNSSTP